MTRSDKPMQNAVINRKAVSKLLSRKMQLPNNPSTTESEIFSSCNQTLFRFRLELQLDQHLEDKSFILMITNIQTNEPTAEICISCAAVQYK